MVGALGVLGTWGVQAPAAHAAPPQSDKPAPTRTQLLPSSGVVRTQAPTPNSPPPRTTPRTRSRTTPPPPPPAGAEDGGEVESQPKPQGPPVDLSETWGYARRGSPRPRYVRNTQDPIVFAPNPVGFYSGVSVQGNQLPPHPARDLEGKPAVLTWAGFERTATGSRVFFQLSAEAEYEVKEKNGVLRIRMRKTKVNVRNNLRRLDLSYFKTPVKTVKVTRKGRDAVATVTLKQESAPSISYVDGASGSGYKLLVISFDHAGASNSAPTRTNAGR